MPTVLNRATLEVKDSVNLPDYLTTFWVQEPDLSPVAGEPKKYWILTGDILSVQNAAGKIAIDDAIALALAAAAEAANAAMEGATQIVTTAPDADALPVPPLKRGLIVCVDDVGGGLEGIAISTAGGWMLFSRTGEI